MPLIEHQYILPEGEIGVWRTDESIEALVESLKLTDNEIQGMEKMSPRRIKEWVSARWLVHHLSGREERGLCLKDDYGKPYLEDSPYQISISHSLNRTAVIAAPNLVGIDIQEIVPKMERISRKFVNDQEWAYIPDAGDKRLEMLHVVWGAKEAMYKAWGKKKIDFRGHLFVDEFSWNGKQTKLKAKLCKGNISMFFDVTASRHDNFILVYAMEKYRYVE